MVDFSAGSLGLNYAEENSESTRIKANFTNDAFSERDDGPNLDLATPRTRVSPLTSSPNHKEQPDKSLLKEAPASPQNHAEGGVSPPRRIESEWILCYTEEEGWPYYFNNITGESCWDEPQEESRATNSTSVVHVETAAAPVVPAAAALVPMQSVQSILRALSASPATPAPSLRPAVGSMPPPSALMNSFSPPAVSASSGISASEFFGASPVEDASPSLALAVAGDNKDSPVASRPESDSAGTSLRDHEHELDNKQQVEVPHVAIEHSDIAAVQVSTTDISSPLDPLPRVVPIPSSPQRDPAAESPTRNNTKDEEVEEGREASPVPASLVVSVDVAAPVEPQSEVLDLLGQPSSSALMPAAASDSPADNSAQAPSGLSTLSVAAAVAASTPASAGPNSAGSESAASRKSSSSSSISTQPRRTKAAAAFVSPAASAGGHRNVSGQSVLHITAAAGNSTALKLLVCQRYCCYYNYYCSIIVIRDDK